MVTQSKDSESHKCGTQGPENWRLGVSPSPGIPVASSHIPRVSQEHLCSYPKPTMGMAMASTSPHSCCLVSGGDPLGTTLIFRWQCWWHCGSSTTPSNTSPGPAYKASLVQLPRASTGESCQRCRPRPTTAMGGDRKGLCRCPWTNRGQKNIKPTAWEPDVIWEARIHRTEYLGGILGRGTELSSCPDEVFM